MTIFILKTILMLLFVAGGFIGSGVGVHVEKGDKYTAKVGFIIWFFLTFTFLALLVVI